MTFVAAGGWRRVSRALPPAPPPKLRSAGFGGGKKHRERAREGGRTEDDFLALLPHLRDEGLAWVDHAGEAVDR